MGQLRVCLSMDCKCDCKYVCANVVSPKMCTADRCRLSSARLTNQEDAGIAHNDVILSTWSSHDIEIIVIAQVEDGLDLASLAGSL